jgi:hypothetical protein
VYVESYQVFLDDNMEKEIPDTSLTLTGLTPLKHYILRVRAIDMAGNMSLKSDSLEVSLNPTGTGSITPGRLSVYPNPVVDDNIFIDLGEIPTGRIAVEMRDQNGGMIYKEVFEQADRKIRISSGGMPRGTYIIMVTKDQMVFKQKIILLSR